MKQFLTTERIDLFDVNMMIVMRTRIKGRASDEQIRRAFEKAVSAHEILGTKIVTGTDGNAYYTSSDPSQSIVFTDEGQDEIIAREERTRFETEHGEFLRAFCTAHTDSGFTVIFCMHHLGGDGKSLLYFIETFMQALDGQKLTYREMRRTDAADLPAESRLSFINSALAEHLNRSWRKSPRRFGFDDLDRAYDKFWSTHRTKVQEVCFDEDSTRKILDFCKKSGIRFTSYISAVMLKNTGCRSIGYAVDVRADGNHAMGNQASGISAERRYDRRKSLAENAAAIQAQIDEKLADPKKKWLMLQFLSALDGTLADAVNMQAAGAFTSGASSSAAELMGYGRKKKDLSITNLTVPDIACEYGSFSVEDISFIPPVVSYSKNVIGIVTVNGRMSITLHTYSDNPLSIEDLLEGIS